MRSASRPVMRCAARRLCGLFGLRFGAAAKKSARLASRSGANAAAQLSLSCDSSGRRPPPPRASAARKASSFATDHVISAQRWPLTRVGMRSEPWISARVAWMMPAQACATSKVGLVGVGWGGRSSSKSLKSLERAASAAINSSRTPASSANATRIKPWKKPESAPGASSGSTRASRVETSPPASLRIDEKTSRRTSSCSRPWLRKLGQLSFVGRLPRRSSSAIA
mmetsp:Transcript_1256/g.4678  ORF Transcript_1256/g.4678 Transcript_1256/m.4678 type:complete len:225 (+) Transcript_1256:387-1061(+)